MKRQNKKPKARKEKAGASQNAGNYVLAKLEAAAKDLVYISETDAPLVPFFWPGEKENLTPELIKQHAKLPENFQVSLQTLDEFFEPVAIEEEWMNDEEK